MIRSVNEIPPKNAFERKACRAGALREFLDTGLTYAEFIPEDGDAPRKAYNGLLMAIRRQFMGKVSISWRHGRIFLKNTTQKEEEEI